MKLAKHKKILMLSQMYSDMFKISPETKKNKVLKELLLVFNQQHKLKFAIQIHPKL